MGKCVACENCLWPWQRTSPLELTARIKTSGVKATFKRTAHERCIPASGDAMIELADKWADLYHPAPGGGE